MILSGSEIREEVRRGRIVFDPPLEDDQWGEASVDLRLDYTFTELVALPNMKISVAAGLGALAQAGFWKKIILEDKDPSGNPQSYVLKPGHFVLAMTHEKVTVPPHLIGMVEGRTTYARVGLAMHQTAPWIQPGWPETKIILEIKNNGPLNMELTPILDRPCQLSFIKLTSELPQELQYGKKARDVYVNQEHAFSPGKAPGARSAPPKRRVASDKRRAKRRSR